MIERKFVAEKLKELQVEQFIGEQIGLGKYSKIEIKKTPLGEKVIVYTAKPGLIVGKRGEAIKDLTKVLKTKFKMENPQVEVAEIQIPDLDAQTVAETISTTLEKFGPKRFKAIGYKMLQRIIDAGALGGEIVVSGRGVPGARAKSWRFYAGYLKKSGDVAVEGVKHAMCTANLKSGTVGIKVSIMPPETILPDKIEIKPLISNEQAAEPVKVEEVKEEKHEHKAEKKPRKRPAKKPKEHKEESKPKEEKTVEEKKEEHKAEEKTE